MMSSNRQSLSKGGLYYLLYNVLNVAFPFVTGIYVARVLLPESIGEVTAAQNLAQYFVILAFLGIPTYGLREIAKTRNDRAGRDQVFSELFVINLISTIAFSVLYLALVLAVPAYRASLPLYLVTGISIVLNALNVSWLFEGLEEFRFISIRNLAFKALSFIMLVIFVRGPEDYIVYALITVLGTAGNYLVNMAFSPRFARIRFRGLNLKRHL
ncbi:MAG: oligosaccharide flippase family protein, partial [Lachnospiraceae bacterium]|nr:oligosaccharide flippase family protein [Lachnospiraceae bacterium]